MINFTVGPVQSEIEIREIGAQQVPYFRTLEFSKIMLENEEMMLKFTKAPFGSKAVFMTCSGTGSMEASIINTLDEKDKVIVVNGGFFGQRFVDLLNLHNVKFDTITLESGKSLKIG